MINVRLSSDESSSSSESSAEESTKDEVRMSAIVMDWTGISVPSSGRDNPFASSVEFSMFVILEW